MSHAPCTYSGMGREMKNLYKNHSNLSSSYAYYPSIFTISFILSDYLSRTLKLLLLPPLPTTSLFSFIPLNSSRPTVHAQSFNLDYARPRIAEGSIKFLLSSSAFSDGDEHHLLTGFVSSVRIPAEANHLSCNAFIENFMWNKSPWLFKFSLCATNKVLANCFLIAPDIIWDLGYSNNLYNKLNL